MLTYFCLYFVTESRSTSRIECKMFHVEQSLNLNQNYNQYV